MTEAVLKSLQCEHFDAPAEVSILLTDDEHIHELNRDYRGIDRPTDVLSFSQLEGEKVGPGTGLVPLGDVIISIDTAKRQASEKGHSLAVELDILVIHSILHLLGYNDSTDEEADDMREHENKVLRQLNDGQTA